MAILGRKHCENSQELVSGIGGMLLQLSCGDERDQTQLGGIRPYHGLGACDGWLARRWQDAAIDKQKGGAIVDFVEFS